MKQIKYLLMGALLMGFSTAAMAQDGTKADVEAVKQLIKSKPADMGKQMKAFYKENKKNPENLVAFGRAFFEAGDTLNAKIAAQNALNATKREYAPAYVLLGDIAAMGDDGGGAAQNYEMAIHFDPKSPDAYRKYAIVYRKIDPQGAVAKLEELRTHVPDYPVDALIGHLSYLSHRYGTAIEAFGRVNPANLSKMDFIEYGFSLYLAKDYAKALNIVETGLKKEPNNATLTRLAMFCSTETEAYDNALVYADALFNKIDKDSVTLSEMDYLNYGNALSGLKRYDEAIERYKEGLHAANNADDVMVTTQADLYQAISEAYKAKEDYPNAIESYQEYLKLTKDASANDYAGLGNLAMRYAKSQEGDARIEAYKRADQLWGEFIEKFPNQEEYGLFQRGMANSNMDPEMTEGLAKPYFSKIIENLTTSGKELTENDKQFLITSYRYLMSYSYQIAKDNQAALEYANKILELKPDDAGIQQVVETLSKAK